MLVHPKHDTIMPYDLLQHFFRFDVPKQQVTIFAARDNEGFIILGAETAADAVFLIPVALVRFDASTLDIVPQTYAGVERPREHVLAVGAEANGYDGRIVLVHEGAEALAGGGVPYSSTARN